MVLMMCLGMTAAPVTDVVSDTAREVPRGPQAETAKSGNKTASNDFESMALLPIILNHLRGFGNRKGANRFAPYHIRHRFSRIY
jgi:hypothetical protein